MQGLVTFLRMTSSAVPPSFNTTSLSGIGGPWDLVAEDFNNDFKLEVVVLEEKTNTVRLFYGVRTRDMLTASFQTEERLTLAYLVCCCLP